MTTQQKRLKEKVQSLGRLVKEVEELKRFKAVNGWFVSFFGESEELTVGGQIVCTVGEAMQELFGPELYQKLVEVKKSF